jgi:cleavage and polyadenylation specificity factor subunit 3
MTHPTRDIFRWLMNDFIRVSKVGRENGIFSKDDITNCLKRIEVVNFHEQTELEGIKFTPYFAGHVLGACMYDIEIAGVRVSPGLETRLPLLIVDYLSRFFFALLLFLSTLNLAPLPQILYTGDYSREDDRHLMAAEIPPNKPDILITVGHMGVWTSGG